MRQNIQTFTLYLYFNFIKNDNFILVLVKLLMVKALYEYREYKAYLSDALQDLGKGAKVRLAKACDCQPGYVSHVLNGTAHFSLEQAQKISEFLGHTKVHQSFFIFLVSKDRAGSADLKNFFETELTKIRESQLILKNRLQTRDALTVEQQAIFYSSWHYGAIHVGIMIPGCQTENGLSDYFQIPSKRVGDIVQYLEEINLIRRNEKGLLEITETQIHLSSDSPLISKHHTNWKMRSITSLDRVEKNDLHYSSVVTVSEGDVPKIRELMVQTIESIRGIVRTSKEESCYSYQFDLFHLGK